jgi:putative ABC transport system ATP-binding protein
MSKRIELNSVDHYFSTRGEQITLFEDLSLTICSQKSHAIVGPSGAGKSSLLLILAGLETPKSGTVTFYQDEHKQSIQQLKQQSGFIFQQFQLLPELDALSNVALPLKLKGDRQAKGKALEWLQQVGLGERAAHKPNELSGGEQQRVAIARAFVANPAFVFADEPTGNLDQKTATKISELMLDCSRIHQTGLVVVTHSDLLASRADHCYHLSDGRLCKQTGVLTQADKGI